MTLTREELWDRLCMINHPETDDVGHPHLRASEVYYHDEQQRAEIASLKARVAELEAIAKGAFSTIRFALQELYSCAAMDDVTDKIETALSKLSEAAERGETR